MTPRSPERSLRPVPTSPLPAEARAALAAIMTDMRNVPRSIIGDPAEVVHFLGRQARRLQGIHDMRVRADPAPVVVPKPASAVLMAPAGMTARTSAEAAFGTSARKPATLPTSRAVIGRRGRSVPVVLRRAREGGQIEMPL